MVQEKEDERDTRWSNRMRCSKKLVGSMCYIRCRKVQRLRSRRCVQTGRGGYIPTPARRAKERVVGGGSVRKVLHESWKLTRQHAENI